MAYVYQFPGNTTTHVPTVSTDLLVYYGRNPNAMPINRYVNLRPVGAAQGLYPKFRNDQQARVVRMADFAWASGAKRPELTNGNDAFAWVNYVCQRWNTSRVIDTTAINQGDFDVVAQAAASAAQQLASARTERIVGVLTTQANYVNSNYGATGTAVGGGAWGSGTSTTPYIKKSLLAMQQQINLNTRGAVSPEDLILVISPSLAIAISTSDEFIDLLKQSPYAMGLWEATNFRSNRSYGLPPNIYGVSLIVDDTVQVTNEVLPPSGGAQDTASYIFPQYAAVLLSKKQVLQSQFGGAFSSFELLEYEPWRTEAFNDTENRITRIHVSEFVIEQFVASESAYYIANANS